MAKLSKDDVLKLAKLAQLKLSDDEVVKYQEEISSVLGYVEQLQDLNLDNIDPTNQVTGLRNVLRPDVIKDYKYTSQQLLSNAPKLEADHIKVKRVLG